MINYMCLSAGHFLLSAKPFSPTTSYGSRPSSWHCNFISAVEVIKSLSWSLTVLCLYLMFKLYALFNWKKKTLREGLFHAASCLSNAGLSWWSSGWECAYQMQGTIIQSLIWKILHATGQLSLCATTYWSPPHPRAVDLATREATTVRSLHISMKTQSSQK